MEVLDLEKTNALLNSTIHEPDIDQNYIYAKVPYETKYYLLINKIKSTGSKYLNDSKAFTEYSNNITFLNILKNTTQIKKENF